MEELRRSLTTDDRALLGSLAHKLKGGSSSVCAQRVGDLAAALERGAPSKPLPELGDLVTQLHEALEECTGFVEAQVA
jgi:HPt (histidine-containing phosphotransfer) domain-containing protein